SMNAQLYVVGSGDGLAWTPATPYVVEAENGVYAFDIANLTQFKISTSFGEWDDFNAGCYVCEYTAENLGNPVELVPGDGNIGTPWKGDYHVVVPVDMSTITLTTTTPAPVGGPAIYVRGGMNEWLNDATEEVLNAWKFQQVGESNVYTLECSIEMGTEFKIADADWDKYNYSLGQEVFAGSEDAWNYNNSDNTTMGEDFTGTITLVLGEKNTDPVMVSFTESAGVGNVAVENAPAEFYNLQGVRVANPENGLYIVRQGGKVSKQLVK
ncbi:MAG: hypothetical protein K2G24_04170, partial [Muribaculaceae bacterium]|nr:hypothetical protein [Muribaculaceae bacterium]